jgi:putative flippase GtrA
MFPRFLVVGSLGFVVDAGLTHLLIYLGLPALWARPPAILAAMLFTWAANRSYTFRSQGGRPVRELSAYALVALVAFALNWGIYAAAIVAGLSTLPAIVLATLCQTGFSFLGYKKLVFRSGSAKP